MLKRFSIFTVVLAILVVPSMLLAADKLVPGAQVTAGESNTVTIPLIAANEDGLMAMDIPLRFSEGVTLREVNFDNTRVSYFDLKVAKIDNSKRTVIIGLVTQITPEAKENLKAGEGPVANLVFEINDESVNEITIEATTMKDPHHSLVYVYPRRENGERLAHVKVRPEFGSTTVSLAGTEGDNLPEAFGLRQNYPNPFNPSTVIEFDLPAPAHVKLTVFNLLGQQVRTLLNEEMPAGTHPVTWDGTSSSGRSVSSGVYFYRIEAGDNVMTKKMMLLK